MKEIVIKNNGLENTLYFQEDNLSYQKMIKSIYNCINDPKNYKSITYNDDSGMRIFSAQYLINSLIVIPKYIK